MSITVPPRGSVGPQTTSFSREPKARREALADQLPLQEGRKVAFHPPPNTAKGDGAAVGKDEEWILAVVTKCINQDKNRWVGTGPGGACGSYRCYVGTRCRIPNLRRTARQDRQSPLQKFCLSVF